MKRGDKFLFAALIVVVFLVLSVLICGMTAFQRCAVSIFQILAFWHNYCG